MNWFQIVFLREDSQAASPNENQSLSCELISNCIFTWGFTRKNISELIDWELWIDFKLYFYVRIHKIKHFNQSRVLVVNWFQIVFLREDSQAQELDLNYGNSCELISNCIFTWGFTSKGFVAIMVFPLWIDFKLYFYVRIHKL